MNENKFRKALSLLQAIADQLPQGDIEEKYVFMYHSALVSIQKELGHHLGEFFIPLTELHHNVTYQVLGDDSDANTLYTEKRYCDRARFLMALNGATNYLNSWVLYPTGLLIKIQKPS